MIHPIGHPLDLGREFGVEIHDGAEWEGHRVHVGIRFNDPVNGYYAVLVCEEGEGDYITGIGSNVGEAVCDLAEELRQEGDTVRVVRRVA